MVGGVEGRVGGFCPYNPLGPAWRLLYRKADVSAPGEADIQAAIREYFDIVKSERQARKRLGELKARIRSYMEEQGLDRVFGDEGFLSRSIQRRFAYDFEKVRAVLEPLGKWEEVLVADDQKLRNVAKTLPPELQVKIEEAKVLTKEYTVIAASVKKFPRPAESGAESGLVIE